MPVRDSVQKRTRFFSLILFVVVVVVPSAAESQELAFKPAGNSMFTFDTGVVKGRLSAGQKSQGIPAMVDVKSSVAIAASGPEFPGLLSYYRVFSANKRYGNAVRDWPKSAALLPDGTVQIQWSAADAHPVEITAIYRWKAPDTLDLITVVKPSVDMKDFEVFLSSYFTKNFKSRIYCKAPFHLPGKPSFVSADVNPLVRGTYPAFPRDHRAAEIIYDGRWDYGPNPVQMSVTQMLAAPLCMRQDAKNKIAVLLMSRPEDCFAIVTPYNMDPPDGVSNHYSMYMSLFGRDLKAGETAQARVRLVVGQNISDQSAVDLYEKFIQEK
jgi:hypothetical protein